MGCSDWGRSLLCSSLKVASSEKLENAVQVRKVRLQKCKTTQFCLFLWLKSSKDLTTFFHTFHPQNLGPFSWKFRRPSTPNAIRFTRLLLLKLPAFKPFFYEILQIIFSHKIGLEVSLEVKKIYTHISIPKCTRVSTETEYTHFLPFSCLFPIRQ